MSNYIADDLSKDCSPPTLAPPQAQTTNTPSEDLLELMRQGEDYLRQRGLESSTSESPKDGHGMARDETQDAIEALVRARSAARASRSFAEADAIKEELLSRFGVEIFDRSGEWKDREGRYGRFGVTAKVSIRPGVKPALSREEIQSLVDQRTMLRRERNFVAADEIRDELVSQGVELYDKLNEWATLDGRLRGMQSTDRPPNVESIGSLYD